MGCPRNAFWFNQFAEPRLVKAMASLLGSDLDFHNGKVRNKPPGYTAYQSWVRCRRSSCWC